MSPGGTAAPGTQHKFTLQRESLQKNNFLHLHSQGSLAYLILVWLLWTYYFAVKITAGAQGVFSSSYFTGGIGHGGGGEGAVGAQLKRKEKLTGKKRTHKWNK